MVVWAIGSFTILSVCMLKLGGTSILQNLHSLDHCQSLHWVTCILMPQEAPRELADRLQKNPDCFRLNRFWQLYLLRLLSTRSCWKFIGIRSFPSYATLAMMATMVPQHC